MIRIGVAAALLASGAFAQAIFVDDSATGARNGSSWTDAFVDLQHAFLIASQGDQVWVAEGIYRPAGPGGSRTKSFPIPSGVAVYGGFDGTEAALEERAGLFDTTILSGDLNGDDGPGFLGNAENSYHVVTFQDAAPDTLLDGFVIEHGHADGAAPNDRGGGLWIDGSPLVRNVTLVNNEASSDGGAVWVDGDGSPLFIETRFAGNAAGARGGGVCHLDGVITLSRCSFLANAARAGGAFYGGAGALVGECEFHLNEAQQTGGAIHGAAMSLNLWSSIFVRNKTTAFPGAGGAMSYENGSGTAANCVFIANSAQRGGAVYCSGELLPGIALVMSNCTVYGNQAHGPEAGGGVYSAFQGLKLHNSVVWANEGPAGIDFAAQFAGIGQAHNSCIEAMSAAAAQGLGLGNISANPDLVDPLGQDGILGTEDDDLRLGRGSPCIDSGANFILAGVPVDYAGLKRFIDDPETVDGGVGTPPVVDMGAFEYQTFLGDVDSVSIAHGGRQELTLLAGPEHANSLYFILGSVTGTSPGLTFGGKTLPLKVDPYFIFTLNNPNHPPLYDSFELLDATGTADALFLMPVGLDPILTGLKVHHAYAVLHPSTLKVLLVSNAVPVDLVP